MPRDPCECIDMVNHFSESRSVPSPRLESKLCFIKASLRGSQDTQPTSCECTMNLHIGNEWWNGAAFISGVSAPIFFCQMIGLLSGDWSEYE